MARNRMIKPSFWVSTQVVECSFKARLLFIGLWNFCDDQGVHPANYKSVKMEIFPGDDIPPEEIRRLVDELLTTGLLSQFEAEGKDYWWVTGWKHQKIDRPTNLYPDPNEYTHLKDIQRTIDEQSTSALPEYKENVIKNEKKQNVSPKPQRGLKRFDEFWSLYPNKQGKKPCEAIWAKRKLDDIADDIIAGVNKWIASTRWQSDDGKYIMNPQRFLNNDTWNDTPEVKIVSASVSEFGF